MSQPIADLLGAWSLRPGALHERLADALRDAIARGQVASGARLPAERALARMLSVSRTTVAAAYATLQREGLLDGRRGSGTYVRAPSRTRIPPAHAPVRLPRVLTAGGLGAGSPIDLTSASIRTPDVLGEDVVAEALRDPALRTDHGYAPAGIPSLRRAVAEHLAQAGLPTRPEEVLVTTGAQQGIGLVASLYVRRGDRVAVEAATFPGAIDVFATAGARLLAVPLDADGVDADALRATAEEHDARLAYLMPSFQNPTGSLLPPDRRRRLARLSAELDLPLVDDVTLHDLWLERPPPPPLAAYEPDAPVLTVGSASKLFWGGLRVGWVRAPEPVVSRLARLKAVADLGSSVPGQAIAAVLLPRAAEIGERRRAQALASAAALEGLLRAHLPDWSWERPPGGFSYWVRMPYGDAEELAQLALRHGVAILPGSLTSPEHEYRDRVRLPLLRETEILGEGLRRLGEAWAAYEPAAGATREPELSVVV